MTENKHCYIKKQIKLVHVIELGLVWRLAKVIKVICSITVTP